MEENSNSQPQPTPAPVAAGPTAAELQAQLDEIKKQSEGRLRDLQQERAKRQELENRLSTPTPSVVKSDVPVDELGQVLNPYIAPVAKDAADAKRALDEMRLEKAQNYLSGKMGREWSAIESDYSFQEKLNGVVKKYGLSGNVYDITVRAYELLQLESLREKEMERTRATNAAANASLPSGNAPIQTSSAKRYSADEFNAMSPREFGNLSKSGDFRKLPDGSFEYVSR